jgi:hypothetical protein
MPHVTENLIQQLIEDLSQDGALWDTEDIATSGGDKRPRTVTGKAFHAIDQPQKFLLIDKIIS